MKKLAFEVQRKLVAGMLTISMMFGVCYNAFSETCEKVFANTGEETLLNDGIINYVSLGDSMTNGYGLTNYNKVNGSDYEDQNGYKAHGDASYPVQFAQWLVREGYAESVYLM